MLRIYENYVRGWHIVLFVQCSDILETIVHCSLIEGEPTYLLPFAIGSCRPAGHFDDMVRDYSWNWRLLMSEDNV